MTLTKPSTVSLSPAALRTLGTGRVILASKSPRRLEIVRNEIGLRDVSVFPSGFAEDFDKKQYAPFEYVLATATQKALDVYQAEIDSDHPPSLVIGADTIVLCDNQILEKPRGVDHHVQMLKTLRDSRVPHKAFTAVACIVPFEEPVAPGYALETHIEVTSVHFKKETTDDQILEYVKQGDATDAAGGYKIQSELGKKFIEKIDGDYYNVVGLPVDSTIQLIEKTLQVAKNDPSDEEEDDDDDEM